MGPSNPSKVFFNKLFNYKYKNTYIKLEGGMGITKVKDTKNCVVAIRINHHHDLYVKYIYHNGHNIMTQFRFGVILMLRNRLKWRFILVHI